MKHAREDYGRIQDPAGLIPLDEGVCARDGVTCCVSPETVPVNAR